jgi:hypothetical protein
MTTFESKAIFAAKTKIQKMIPAEINTLAGKKIDVKFLMKIFSDPEVASVKIYSVKSEKFTANGIYGYPNCIGYTIETNYGKIEFLKEIN